MAIKHEIVASIGDLKIILECECGGRIYIAPDANGKSPEWCPGKCGKQIDAALGHKQLSAAMTYIRKREESGDIPIRVLFEFDEPNG